MSTFIQTRFHFYCIECGFSDAELGHLAPLDDLYCVVCIEETQRHVRLQRWAADEPEEHFVSGIGSEQAA